MKTARRRSLFGFGRAMICMAAASMLLSSFGCANGGLFGRKEPEKPQTMQQFLALKRPK